jgi:hypothetical protein
LPKSAHLAGIAHRIPPPPEFGAARLLLVESSIAQLQKKQAEALTPSHRYHTSETIMRLFKMPCLGGTAHAQEELPYECARYNELIGHLKISLTPDLRDLTIKLALFSGGLRARDAVVSV